MMRKGSGNTVCPALGNYFVNVLIRPSRLRRKIHACGDQMYQISITKEHSICGSGVFLLGASRDRQGDDTKAITMVSMK